MPEKQNETDPPRRGRRLSIPGARSDPALRVRRVIMESLDNQILLAVKLLETVKAARAVRRIEAELIEEASKVCAKLIQIVGRLPELQAEKNWHAIQNSVEDLRSALLEIIAESSATEPVDTSLLESGLRLSLENENLRNENAVLQRRNEALAKEIKQTKLE